MIAEKQAGRKNTTSNKLNETEVLKLFKITSSHSNLDRIAMALLSSWKTLKGHRVALQYILSVSP